MQCLGMIHISVYNWPFRNPSGNWGEFQILTNRQTDATTWKIMLRLVIWPSIMLLGWTDTKLWTLKCGSKSIQTSLILRQRSPESYKLLNFFRISVILSKMSKHSDFHLIFFQIEGAWQDFTVVTKLIKNFKTLYGFGGHFLKVETFVWILNHISKC